MPASYPSAVKSFSTKVDGAGNPVYAAHVNDLQLEVVAMQTEMVGAWTSYTPTWSSNTGNAHTLGDGTLAGAYRVVGKTCHFRINLTFGSTTTVSSDGIFIFALPTAAVSTPSPVVAYLYDQNVGSYGGIAIMSSTTTLVLVAAGAASGCTATAPFTWATSDQVQINGSYEIA